MINVEHKDVFVFVKASVVPIDRFNEILHTVDIFEIIFDLVSSSFYLLLC
jgi:hypothetical protein